LKWNWDPEHWKGSTKVLLGLVTIWPVIYIGLFFVAILSMFVFLPFEADRSKRSCGDLDLIQLDRKIKNGELKQLTIKPDEVTAMDHAGKCEYHTYVSNESTREEILRDAREFDANGAQRVAKIDEQTSEPGFSPVFPIGIIALFGAHFFTILLSLGLMPLYIVLVVKSDRHDQTMRIIWVVLLCMMGMLAMPVYWYLYIWRDAPPVSSVPNSP
jgi:hypothetical protein